MRDYYLEEVLPFLKHIDKERREQFLAYFRNAPLWIFENVSIEKIEKGKTFIREGEPVEAVYFIGDGIIKATDYRIYGISFDFMLFTNVYAYGGMEIIMDMGKYRTSLQTVTDCIVLKIPKAKFNQWMKTDIQSLRYEAKLMGEYLLEQARNVRAFLFLQGQDRLAMLLINRYEKYAEQGVLRIRNDRQELSDFTGLSVKTITRSVKKLREEGLISKEGSNIVIGKEQYASLKENLMEVINSTALSDTEKQEAVDKMVSLTDIAQRESDAEMLLEAKGFTDVVVSITEDAADVVLNMGDVTDAKRAQIEDIVKRKTKVSAENIVITPITTGEKGK